IPRRVRLAHVALEARGARGHPAQPQLARDLRRDATGVLEARLHRGGVPQQLGRGLDVAMGGVEPLDQLRRAPGIDVAPRPADVPLTAERFDQLSQRTPLIANIRPAGKYLMADFFYAGGLRALLVEISDLLSLGERTVNGRTLGENIAGAEVFNRDVILPR